MRKILFIQPSCYDESGQVIKKRTLHFVGLVFPILAALTPDDWEVEVCVELIEDIPFDTDADVVGIGGMGQSTRRGFFLFRLPGEQRAAGVATLWALMREGNSRRHLGPLAVKGISGRLFRRTAEQPQCRSQLAERRGAPR